ncbi:dynactin subunit 1-like isoform X2 [Myripristis murdjan]|uniref:dynactin subunit 1-like isoform X2 n=1 Tax=Myripristis murdjan TaxID=586833 RepID=UPI00117631F7|nr:dynactin subunit 1-like isoform X2 [Myripristis murdjan]
MDVSEDDKMQLKVMSEKIAELDHSQSQLRKLNVDMRHWLEVADDEVAQLRMENEVLSNKVKIMEQVVNDAGHVEAELCRVRTLLAEEQARNSCNQKEIQKWVSQQNALRDQNEKLMAEWSHLQQQTESDRICISNLRAALQTLQQNLSLKHCGESAEESSNVIRELRLKVQDLRSQLEARQDDASCARLDDLMGGKDGSAARPLSFAEEMALLATSVVESTEAVEQEATVKLESPPVRVHTKSLWCSCTGSLAFMVSFLMSLGVWTYFGETFWNCMCCILEPFCDVHYVGLPPI